MPSNTELKLKAAFLNYNVALRIVKDQFEPGLCARAAYKEANAAAADLDLLAAFGIAKTAGLYPRPSA